VPKGADLFAVCAHGKGTHWMSIVCAYNSIDAVSRAIAQLEGGSFQVTGFTANPADTETSVKSYQFDGFDGYQFGVMSLAEYIRNSNNGSFLF
jgi:hypothetical protein